MVNSKRSIDKIPFLLCNGKNSSKQGHAEYHAEVPEFKAAETQET
jgi:hypothetical protein